MSRYIETQTRKIISSYGGVGSIIETPNGALIIEDFDKWPFFQKNELYETENHIKDDRLLNRLRFEKGFPKLKAFIKVPTNNANFKVKSIPNSITDVISARFFPEWFYCNSCQRFRKISEWWKGWKITLQKYKKDNKYIRNSFYEGPKCCFCYDKSQGKRMNELEQVRFILTSLNGEVEDLPWERWNKVQKGAQETDTISGSICLDFDNLCCENQDLRYIKSTKLSDMAGITIKCEKCGSHQTLSGLFGLRIPVFSNDNAEKKIFKKPVIRTSNSVYYPIIVSSIYLPTELFIKKEDAIKIDKWLKKGKSEEFIVEVFTEEGYCENMIKEYIKNQNQPDFEPEIEYRKREYNFLTNPQRRNYIEDNLIFDKQSLDKLQNYGFIELIKLKKLKMTVVQTAYTRQEPLDNDQFLNGEFEKIKPKYTCKYGKKAEYLPAVENFGEGIFINFDNERINKWIDEIQEIENCVTRIRTIQRNADKNELIKKDRFLDFKYLTKFLLIHTLSHVIIKEFEFSVGYPATSLKERLYIDKSDMIGFLIYTVAGAEGSYGGLISQANESSFIKILKSSLSRAKDCASDPVCYNTIDGQGIGGLNMAACYSCALLPDISCEEFNSFLDRALLIDENFGFFRNIF